MKKNKNIQPFIMHVNPTQSRRVQLFLFKNGYSWAAGEKRPILLNRPTIIFWHTMYSDKPVLQEGDFHDGAPFITYEQFFFKYNFKFGK